jgi:hypothetical protein
MKNRPLIAFLDDKNRGECPVSTTAKGNEQEEMAEL